MSPGLRSLAERGFLRALNARCERGKVTSATTDLTVRGGVVIGAVGNPRSASGRSGVDAEIGTDEERKENTETFE